MEQNTAYTETSVPGTSDGISTHPAFVAVVYASIALVVFTYVVAAGYILFTFSRFLDGEYGADAILGVIATVIVGACLAYSVKSLLRCGKPHDGDFDLAGGTRSGLAAVAWGLPLMWVLSLIYILIVSLFGADMGGGFMDEMPKEILAAELMLAGPFEELVFRMLLIGIPMAVIAGIKNQQHCGKYLLGGFGQSKTGWVVIIVAAILFGMAHMSGWDLSKIPQAAILGLVLGYIFAEYGLYACVLAHSVFDVTSVIGYVLGDTCAGVVEIAFIVIGVVVLLFAVKHLVDKKPRFGDLPSMPSSELDSKGAWRRHRSQHLRKSVPGAYRRLQGFGLYYVTAFVTPQPADDTGEIDLALAYGQMFVLEAVVIVYVDVPYAPVEHIQHGIRLTGRERMADVECHLQVRPVDYLGEFGCRLTDHHRYVGHVLYAHVSDAEGPCGLVDHPARFLGRPDAPVARPGY